MLQRYGRWALVVALSAMLLAPTFVLADDDDGEGNENKKWDPTGTYIAVTESDGAVPQGTVILLTVVPGDKAGERYLGIQNRINNFDAEIMSTMGIEISRTGKNSFDFELVAYSRLRDETGMIVVKNAWYITGVFARNEVGEVWVTDQQMWFSPGCPNILDPGPDCVVIGPFPLEDGEYQSQLGHGGPTSGL